jgi:hypothetical protein
MGKGEAILENAQKLLTFLATYEPMISVRASQI